MTWFSRRRNEQDSYNELKNSNTEGELGSLHGYNTRAERKRLRNRKTALNDAFDQVIYEEEKATDISRNTTPINFEDGEYIAEESVNSTFWENLL